MLVYSWVSPPPPSCRFLAVSPIGQVGGGVADGFQIVEVTVGVPVSPSACRGSCRRSPGSLHVGHLGEVEVAAVRLRLAGEGVP
jgi:hypothetical protein